VRYESQRSLTRGTLGRFLIVAPLQFLVVWLALELWHLYAGAIEGSRFFLAVAAYGASLTVGGVVGIVLAFVDSE